MKRICSLAVVLCLILVGICGCGNSVVENNELHDNVVENNSIETTETTLEDNTTEIPTESTQIAVVYFSATGTTKTVAEYIKEEMNADIFEIIPKQAYTAEDIDYGDNARATIEQNDENARPELGNDIDLTTYDVVFLGYPIWYGKAPRIIQTFIETGKLYNKTVIPFCTSDSTGIAGSEEVLKQYGDINWVAGSKLTTSQDEVSTWTKNLVY